MQRRQWLQAAAVAPWLAVAAGAQAQAQIAEGGFPSRPVRILVGYAAGGTGDLSCRIIAPFLAERLGQSVVIENRPGAGGIPASQAALALPADGHTLLLAASGNFGISPVLMKQMPFDAVADFDMVAQIASFGYVFTVAANSPFKTIRDVIDFARANPGKLGIGTVQVGSAQFFAAEFFKSVAGIQAVTVPYRAWGDLVPALRSGDIQLAVETVAPMIGQIRGGALRAVGFSEDAAFPGLPEAAPIGTQGLPNYVVKGWNGLAARAGTPPAAIQRLGREVAAVLALEEVKRKFIDLGIIARYGDPATMRGLQQADIRKWGAVMSASRIEKQ